MLGDVDLDPAEERWVRGNIASLECHRSNKRRDFAKVIEASEEALRDLPLEQSALRSEPYLMGSLARRSSGDAFGAQQLIRDGRAEFAEDPAGLGFMYSADAHGYLMAADMPGLRSSARQYHEHCEKHRFWMIGALRAGPGRPCPLSAE